MPAIGEHAAKERFATSEYDQVVLNEHAEGPRLKLAASEARAPSIVRLETEVPRLLGKTAIESGRAALQILKSVVARPVSSREKADAIMHAAASYVTFPGEHEVIARVAVAARDVASNGHGQFALAALVGYGIASYVESWFHENIAHASKHTLAFLKARTQSKRAWVRNAAESLLASYRAHRAHHGATFQTDHVTQFDSPAQKAKLDASLQKHGDQSIIDYNYGLTISKSGVIKWMLPTVAVESALMGSMVGLGVDFHAASIPAFLAPALLMPMMSKYVHPMLHQSREKALAMAGPLTRWLLSTRLGGYISRQHYVHHARTEGVNYNLMPMADVLRGKNRKPTAAELKEMNAIDMIR